MPSASFTGANAIGSTTINGVVALVEKATGGYSAASDRT